MLKLELKKCVNNVLITSQHDLRHKTFKYIFDHTHSKISINIDSNIRMTNLRVINIDRLIAKEIRNKNV